MTSNENAYNSGNQTKVRSLYEKLELQADPKTFKIFSAVQPKLAKPPNSREKGSSKRHGISERIPRTPPRSAHKSHTIADDLNLGRGSRNSNRERTLNCSLRPSRTIGGGKGKLTPNLMMDGENVEVGPGTYDAEPILGAKRVIAAHPTAPSYSIGSKFDFHKLFINKELDQSTTNLEVPGVGRYHPDHLKFTKTTPRMIMSREKKFFQLTAPCEFKAMVPSGYANYDTNKPKIKGGSISRASRFYLSMNSTSPGPAAYKNERYKSVDGNMRRTISGKGTFGRATVKLLRSSGKNLSPGPARYHPNLIYSNKQYSIPLAKRTNKSMLDTPGPQNYFPIEVTKFKPVFSRKFSFGTSRRDFNFKKCKSISIITNWAESVMCVNSVLLKFHIHQETVRRKAKGIK